MFHLATIFFGCVTCANTKAILHFLFPLFRLKNSSCVRKIIFYLILRVSLFSRHKNHYTLRSKKTEKKKKKMISAKKFVYPK